MTAIPDEGVTWPVRLWWLAEDKVPALLAAERRFWRMVHMARHPRAAWFGWRKWRTRPRPGDRVRDCGGEIRTVAGYGDDDPDRLVFTDGHAASWMNCCDRAADLTPDEPAP